MAAKKSKKERMKESASKKINAVVVNVAQPEEKKKVDVVSQVPQGAIYEAMTTKDTVMVVLYSVLLFLAMTVQTGTMSMVLTVLAVASLVGKKPLENLRAHLSLPVIGLVAFAWMCGAASLYSRFGSSAVLELYKIMASFSMVVILLARFEKKHVRGLLWGFATVCAVIALVCIDAGCRGKLFEAFYALMDSLGASYAHVYEQTGNRDGIYNNSNLTGALLGLAVIVSLYLAHTAEKIVGRFFALVVFGISAVSFLVALSRGAIAVFVMAILIYLAVEPSKNRTALFFLMLNAGVVSVCVGFVAMPEMGDGATVPSLLALGSGVIVFALDWLVGARLAKKLQGHGKLVVVFCVAAIALVGVVAFPVFQMTEPYMFAEDGYLYRGLALEPGEYTICAAVESEEPVRVVIESCSEDDVLVNLRPEIYSGPLDGAEFVVEEDSVWVYFRFVGQKDDVLREVRLSDGTEIPLTYTWLPEIVAARLQDGLLMSNSVAMRRQYVRDGVTLFKQNVLFGHGLGSTEYLLSTVQPFHYESVYIHNHILQVMDEMGVVGLGLFLILLLGSLLLLLRRRRETKDSLAAMLIACWVMMNLHSLMEINFSIRMFQCAAFFLLLIPVFCYAKPMPQKWNKICGYVVVLAITLQLAVFGYLLHSHRSVEKDTAEFETSSPAVFMAAMQDYAEREPFDKTQHQLNFIANAVVMDDVRYNDTMREYVGDLYETGSYATYAGLACYYWLPQGNFDEVFACSRLAVKQVPAASDVWNQQLEFLRKEVMPAMKDDMVEFMDGVMGFEEDRLKYNAERLEETVYSVENQEFLETMEDLRNSSLSSEEIYRVLSVVGSDVTN